MNEEVNVPLVSIKKIKFNDGSEILLEKNDIVVFVGANNVGKSRALKDISDDLLRVNKGNGIIIKEIKYEEFNFSNESIENFFERNYNFYKSENGSYDIPTDFDSNLNYPPYMYKNFLNTGMDSKEFFKFLYRFLTTEKRLNLTAPAAYNNAEDKFRIHIMNDLESNEKIKKINELLANDFEKAIDIGEKYIDGIFYRLYKTGNKKEIEKTINSNRMTARKELSKLEDLYDQGDGLRSAVGILVSLLSSEQSIFLIDEPETFLHPPQARMLGRNIVDLTENKQCFVATHNIDIIRGILEKNSSRVKIVKIDRNSENNEFNVLESNDIFELANDRNLKYTNIMNGLFYDRVVLCENESDCKFYSVILEALNTKLYQNTLFCAVGGKDQFKKIIPILKRLKISYKVIADIDLIDNNNNLKQLLKNIGEPNYKEISEIHKKFLKQYENKNSEIKKQSVIKKEIEKIFTDEEYMTPKNVNKIKDILKYSSSLKLLKKMGISSIDSCECMDNFDEIKSVLNRNDIYIVECGEIERFIPKIEGHGEYWVEKVLKQYPNINDKVYDKVKVFIRTIFKI